MAGPFEKTAGKTSAAAFRNVFIVATKKVVRLKQQETDSPETLHSFTGMPVVATNLGRYSKLRCQNGHPSSPGHVPPQK